MIMTFRFKGGYCLAYLTKQLQAVISCLMSHGEQPVSVAQLRHDLKAMGCPVGLATIYRQLEGLEQRHQLHKITTTDGAVYQYCHQHAQESTSCCLLHCQQCGRVVHLDCDDVKNLYGHLESQHHFHINPRKTLLTGLCESCWKKEQP